jgi:putative oxidoreductase
MDSDRIAAEFFLNRVSGQFALASAIFRVMSGLVFGYFGVTKLADLSGTASQFYAMGLPAGRTLPVLVALLETFGGLALVAGLLTRLFAGLLALEMVGACLATLHIITGRAAFLLLPLFMLVLMVFVLWAGPAVWSVDERLAGWLARSRWSWRLGLPRRLRLGERFATVAGGMADPAEAERGGRRRADRAAPAGADPDRTQVHPAWPVREDNGPPAARADSGPRTGRGDHRPGPGRRAAPPPAPEPADPPTQPNPVRSNPPPANPGSARPPWRAR